MTPDIERAKEILVNEYHPDKIILFGSYARGDAGPDSDIDLLVISDREKDLPGPQRGLQVRLKLAVIWTPMDLLFFTSEEFGKYQGLRQSFSATVAREGVVLYGCPPSKKPVKPTTWRARLTAYEMLPTLEPVFSGREPVSNNSGKRSIMHPHRIAVNICWHRR